MKDSMSHPFEKDLLVELEVDAKIGDTWYECKWSGLAWMQWSIFNMIILIQVIINNYIQSPQNIDCSIVHDNNKKHILVLQTNNRKATPTSIANSGKQFNKIIKMDQHQVSLFQKIGIRIYKTRTSENWWKESLW